MDPCETPAAITVIARLLAARMCDDELTLLAAALTQLGDTLALIAAGRSVCRSRRPAPAQSARADQAGQSRVPKASSRGNQDKTASV